MSAMPLSCCHSACASALLRLPGRILRDVEKHDVDLPWHGSPAGLGDTRDDTARRPRAASWRTGRCGGATSHQEPDFKPTWTLFLSGSLRSNPSPHASEGEYCPRNLRSVGPSVRNAILIDETRA